MNTQNLCSKTEVQKKNTYILQPFILALRGIKVGMGYRGVVELLIAI